MCWLALVGGERCTYSMFYVLWENAVHYWAIISLCADYWTMCIDLYAPLFSGDQSNVSTSARNICP